MVNTRKPSNVGVFNFKKHEKSTKGRANELCPKKEHRILPIAARSPLPIPASVAAADPSYRRRRRRRRRRQRMFSLVIMRSSVYGITCSSWRAIKHSSVAVPKLDSVFTRFRVRCFSAGRLHSSNPDPQVVQDLDPEPPVARERENDAFYVVRKGDVIGIYRNLSDCQAQVSSSICDPSVGVYKGNSLRRETEEYLASRSLKNAIYSLNAVDLRKDMFGTLVPCPFTQPDGAVFFDDRSRKETSTRKGSTETDNKSQPDEDVFPVDGSSKEFCSEKTSKTFVSKNSQPDEDVFPVDGSSKEFCSEKTSKTFASKNSQLDKVLSPVNESSEKSTGDKKLAETVNNSMTYILEFDGASKGNPGKSGAGAVLRREDGSVVCHLREGLGDTTNNVAEYRAVIMGMKYALKKGYQQIRVQGDSLLVCKQVNGAWKTKDPNMAALCKEVKGLKKNFQSFKISHVMRELNSDADAQANIAASLPPGEFSEESLVT